MPCVAVAVFWGQAGGSLGRSVHLLFACSESQSEQLWAWGAGQDGQACHSVTLSQWGESLPEPGKEPCGTWFLPSAAPTLASLQATAEICSRLKQCWWEAEKHANALSPCWLSQSQGSRHLCCSSRGADPEKLLWLMNKVKNILTYLLRKKAQEGHLALLPFPA